GLLAVPTNPSRETKWWARFRLRSSSYGGQVVLPTLRNCVVASAERFSPFLTTAHLPRIEVEISGPHGAGQYLRRALSTCFLDFSQYRCRVGFRLWLPACCGNVIESGPESINPDCSLQSKRASRLPVRAAHAPYSHHVAGNLGVLR